MDTIVSIANEGGYRIVTVNEEKLDASATPLLKSELVQLFDDLSKEKDGGKVKVCIDLSKVRYGDTSFLNTLDFYKKLASDYGQERAYLRGVNDAVDRLLAISRYDTRFEFI